MTQPSAYAYRWYRSGIEISGATGVAYQLQPADSGSVVTFAVTATNSAGSTTATSSGVDVGAAGTGPSGQVAVYLTNGAGTVLLAQQDNLTLAPHAGPAGTNPVTVDTSTTYQTMDGFGAALPDSSAWLLATKMSPSQRSSLLTSLFGPGGYGLSALRICMGSPDFSAGPYYTYDAAAPGLADESLASFSIARDDNYIIPVIQEALAINPSVKVIAAPWSPPAWMTVGDTVLGSSINATPAVLAAYADYFVKFVEAYRTAGIPIFAVSCQNEPENANGAYPTCLWGAAQEATFIVSYLKPALVTAGLATRIMGYDHNWGDSTGFAQALVDTPGVAADLYAVAWHAYAGDETDQLAFQAANPAVGHWLTEICGSVDPASSFGADLSWHNHEIVIGSPRAGSMGITYWCLVLDQTSQPYEGGAPNTVRPLVTIDSSTGAVVSYAPELYALAHTAKFVKPGARRVHSDSYGSGYVETVAYLNPNGSKVCHLLCSAGSAQTFDFVDIRDGVSVSMVMQPGDVCTLAWGP